jgi:CDP-diglyceride synthetase
MFITALFAPNLHQVCLPLFATYAMIWFLTMRRSASSLSEIASTFTGMFLYGYVPSFWVRIRLIGGQREPSRLAPLVTPMLSLLGKTASSLPAWIPKAIHLPITTGAVFIFWSWLSIAFSDVGAYFSGRYFGRTKLGAISPAAGTTSPNKTVEGVIGGTITSVLFALCGAWVQKWPYWWLTGAIHGVCLAFLGLIGDLTASMLKRDAGLKDFGDLIPEHGGILDRVDSFIFTAPYSWIFLSYIIPGLKAFSLR